MGPIQNPDVSNENPEYWEKVLHSHGLSMKRGARADKIAFAKTVENLSGNAELRATELGGNGLGFDVRKVEPTGHGPDKSE